MRANAGPDMMGWVMRMAIFSSGELEEGRRRGDGSELGDGGSGVMPPFCVEHDHFFNFKLGFCCH